MRLIVLCLLLACWIGGPVTLAADAPVRSAPQRPDRIRVLVITGGHEFEPSFFDLFEGHPDIVAIRAEQPEAQAWFAPERADEYDVMVWYDLWPKISDEAKRNLVALLKKGKGLVALHHSIADYTSWPEGIRIIGGRYNLQPTDGHPASVFKHGEEMQIHVADPDHPITRALSDFQIHDESYDDVQILPDVHPLLTTEHPTSMDTVAWTHTYGKSPVVYIQLGHDSKAYENPSYRLLVAQSIRFAAGELPDPSEKGFEPIFNGKNFDGWANMGSAEGWKIKDGRILSDTPYKGNWLRFDREVEDFVLRVDWRVSEQGNSGVFVRTQEQGYPWVTGSEVQITTIDRDDAHCTGSLYGVVPVDPRLETRADVWHSYEIQCRGPYYKVFFDSVPVIDVDARRVPALEAKPRTGYVGIQDNHSENGWIEYRNIRLKEIDMDPTQAWRLGTQTYTFRLFTLFEAIDKAGELGLDCIEAYPGQTISSEHGDVKFGHDMPVEMQEVVRKKLDAAGLPMVCYGVVILKNDEKELRRIFDFCKAMRIETITAEPEPDAFDLLEKLTEEYGINVAIHNHPKPSRYWNPQTVLDAVKGRNHYIGACADTGHWVRSGLDPLECLKKLEGRIISLHFKDLNKKAPDAHDVPWGTGVCDAKAMLAELQRQDFQGTFSIEYEYNWENSMPDIARSVEFFRKTVDELAK